MRLSRREWRALALIALAVMLIAAASTAYLLSPWPAKPQTSAQSINPLLATLISISYDFVTPSIGWAVENPPPNGGFVLFRTTDGAKHWQKQLALGGRDVGLVQTAVQFLDQKHGYIAAGEPFQRLYRTSEGGGKWESAPLPKGSGRVDAIAFSNASYGWLLVAGRVSTLYATSDAGSTWRRLPDPPADADSLSFRSPTEAWMGSLGVGPPHVYMSRDAGNTWRRHDLPPQPGQAWEGGVPAGVALLPHGGVQVFLPPVARPDLVGRGFSLTLTSFDQGTTWRYVPTPPGAVAYQDSRHWWAMSGTSLFKSSDAGQTWALVTPGLPDWQYIPRVLDSKHAWADTYGVFGYGLALTEDGGLHWSRGTVPPPTEA